MGRKSKSKLGVIALVLLCAVFAFALQGCTTPDLLATKLAAEIPNFTVTVTTPSQDAGTTIFRINDKQFCSKTTAGDEISYLAILKDGDTYFRIAGTDAKYFKYFISAEEFKSDTTVTGYCLQAKAIGEYHTYFTEGEGGIYKLNPDKMLEYVNFVSQNTLTELPDEIKTQYETLSLEFIDNTVQLTTSTEEGDVVITFSEIGLTRLEAFTTTKPVEVK